MDSSLLLIHALEELADAQVDLTAPIDPLWDFTGHRPFVELTAEEKLMELGRQIVFVKTWQGICSSAPPRQPSGGPCPVRVRVPEAPTEG